MYHMICITGILYLFNHFQLEQKIHQDKTTASIISLTVMLTTTVIAHLSYSYIETYYLKKRTRKRYRVKPFHIDGLI